jgi:TolB-like protein/DNA-binding winged helix-turn-helix (wHTH) protein/cytochrome c-type biogenesis protein CcmH/NrfG
MNDVSHAQLQFERFTLDPARHRLLDGTREVPLRPKAYDVLRVLAERADRVASKEEIMAAVWPNVFVTDDSLVQCVTEIRQALGDAGPRIIRTVPRRGYRLVAQVAAADGGQTRPTVWVGLRQHRPRRAVLAIAACLLVALAAAGWWWGTRHNTQDAGGPWPADRPSIAVLPFDDLGGDARQERLADAFTEDLITELARARDLLVIARNSAFRYKGKPLDVREIGRELGVRYVIEGSVQTGSDRLRVTTQLIDAATGTHLWSERFDRPAADFFALQDEVVGRIVGTLTGFYGPLQKAGAEAARRKRPRSLQAYDYYLLSKAPYIRHDAAGMAEARPLLERALELDPMLVRAWEVLAWTHIRDAWGGWNGDRQRSWEAFHRAARKAVEVDPFDGGAHVVAGMSYFAMGEVERGAAAWDRALALAPNDANVLRPIGAMLARVVGVERAAEGVALVERSIRLDPLHPPNVASALGFACYYAGCYEKGIVAFKKRTSMNADHRAFIAMSYAQLGRQEEAAAEVALALRDDPGFTAEAWVNDFFFQPGGSSAALFFDGARKAGLPLCAPAARAALDPRNRLPECDAERANAAVAKRKPR